MTLRALIADDHPLVREGLRSLVESMPEAELVGEAGDGPEAVRLALKVSPNVAIMDLNLPGMNGIEATGRIVSARPDTAVPILTMFEDDDLVFSAMRQEPAGLPLEGRLARRGGASHPGGGGW